jgi:hypothetical protein
MTMDTKQLIPAPPIPATALPRMTCWIDLPRPLWKLVRNGGKSVGIPQLTISCSRFRKRRMKPEWSLFVRRYHWISHTRSCVSDMAALICGTRRSYHGLGRTHCQGIACDQPSCIIEIIKLAANCSARRKNQRPVGVGDEDAWRGQNWAQNS